MANNISIGQDSEEKSQPKTFVIELSRCAWESTTVTVNTVVSLEAAKEQALAIPAQDLEWTLDEERSNPEVVGWESPASGLL